MKTDEYIRNVITTARYTDDDWYVFYCMHEVGRYVVTCFFCDYIKDGYPPFS